MNNRGAPRDRLRTLFTLCVALIVSCLTATAPAGQPEAGAAFRRLAAGGDPWVAPQSTSGHAWAFLPAPSSDSAADSDGYLVHLVPRQGVARASAGSVRLVRPLRRPPLTIAGWKGEALLLMGPPGDTAAEPADRTVSAVRAVGPISLGNWDYAPPERLELKGVVPADALPRSMVGSELGPLLIVENDATRELQAAAIDEAGKWRPLRLPPGAPLTAQAGEVHALASASGVLIAFRRTGEPELALWRGVVLKDGKDGPVIRWETQGALQLPPQAQRAPILTLGPEAPFWLMHEGGQTLLAHRTLNEARLWRLESGRPIEVWSAANLPPAAALLVAEGLGTVTAISFEQPPAAEPRCGGRSSAPPAPDAASVRIVEVSHSTGVVLADVAAHTDGFFSRRELWVLWLLFIGIGVVVLLVVVKTDGPQQVELPGGVALATPGRRAAAGVIDLLLGVGGASLAWGGSPSEWLSPATSASASLPALASIPVICAVLCAAFEAALGASPGKMAVGARVLGLCPLKPATEGKRAPGEPLLLQTVRLGVAGALVRNAIRWLMPPLGLALIADNNWRHPGDMLAGSVVVTRADDGPADGQAGPDEPGFGDESGGDRR